MYKELLRILIDLVTRIMSKENIALVFVVTTKVAISHVDKKVIALDTIMK